MAPRVLTNEEEANERWLRTPNLSLVTSYEKAPVRKTPAEISRSKNARVIPIKEENENKERLLREHFSPSIPIKTPDGMTPAEMLRQQNEMLIEIARGKISEDVKKNLQINNKNNPFKQFIDDGINKLKNIIYPRPRMNSLGSTPPKSNGGYNYRKYKYTNITKNPAKPNILAKKPAKPKILTKKPKKKILTKKPAKPKYKKIS